MGVHKADARDLRWHRSRQSATDARNDARSMVDPERRNRIHAFATLKSSMYKNRGKYHFFLEWCCGSEQRLHRKSLRGPWLHCNDEWHQDKVKQCAFSLSEKIGILNAQDLFLCRWMQQPLFCCLSTPSGRCLPRLSC